MNMNMLRDYIKVHLNAIMREEYLKRQGIFPQLTQIEIAAIRKGKRLLIPKQRIDELKINKKIIKEINKNRAPIRSVPQIEAIILLTEKQNKIPLHKILGISETATMRAYYSNYPSLYIRVNNGIFLEEYIYNALLIAQEAQEISPNKEISYDVETDNVPEYDIGEEKINELELKKVIPNNLPFNYFEKHVLEKFPTWEYTTDMSEPNTHFDPSTKSLQVIKATITAFYKSVKYPISIAYTCSDIICKLENKGKYYTMDTNANETMWLGSIKCNHVTGYTDKGDPKYCNKVATPNPKLSKYKMMYFYSMRVKVKNKNPNEPAYEEIKVYSTKQLKRFGHQIVAGFNIETKSPTEKLFMLIDSEELPSIKFKLPEKNPDNLYTLQITSAIDDFIKQRTKQTVFGVEKVKALLLIQAVYQQTRQNKFMNTALLGAPSSGKTYVPKKYLPVLYPNYLFTTGLRVSEPAMRGTTIQIPVVTGKEEKVETTGHLGTYKIIMIEEGLGKIQANGTSKGITDEMKDEFEIENCDYGNNKAFSNNLNKRKTANILLTGNIESSHKGKYNTKIIKKLLTPAEGSLDSIQPIDQNIMYNLDIDEYKYDPKLQATIASVRSEFTTNEIDWATGIEIPTRQRYPFTIVFENNDTTISRQERLTIAQNTLSRPKKSASGEADVEEAKLLENDTMQNFYKSIISFMDKCESLPNWGDINLQNLIKYDDAMIKLGTNLNVARETKIPSIIFETLRLIEGEIEITNKTLEFGKSLIKAIINPMSVKDLSIEKIKRATYTRVLNDLRAHITDTTPDNFNIIDYLLSIYDESQHNIVKSIVIKIKNNLKCYNWIKERWF